MDQQFESDGPVIGKIYLTAKFHHGLLPAEMPPYIQEKLSRAEQEFKSRWAAYCNQSYPSQEGTNQLKLDLLGTI